MMDGGSHSGHSQNRETIGYTCPMHPEVRSSSPGTCPTCGMRLVPIKKTEDEAPAHHTHEPSHEHVMKTVSQMSHWERFRMSMTMTKGTEHTGLETLILSCGYLQGRMPHRIEVFSANCPLCNEIVDEIEAGKCAGCQLTIYDVSKNSSLARQFGVRVVPTVIIDGEVKIEGRPDIPFVCSDETYAHFKEKYPVLHELGSSEDRDS